MGRAYSHQTARWSRSSLDQFRLGPMHRYSRNQPRARRVLALSRFPPIRPSTGRTQGSPRPAGGSANQSPQEPGEEPLLRCESAQWRSHESLQRPPSASPLQNPGLNDFQTRACGEKIALYEEIIPHPKDRLRAHEDRLAKVVVVKRVVIPVLLVLAKRVQPLYVRITDVMDGIAALRAKT